MHASRHKFALFVFLLSSLFALSPKADEENAKTLLAKMFASIENVRTLRYELKIVERIKGKVRSAKSSIKLQRSPRKIYLNLGGPELLWLEGQNNGMALVNPNAFPYFNLNLDPQGSILRENQHHSIHEIGFDYLGGVLKSETNKVGDKFDEVYVYTGEDRLLNRSCYKITISHKDFAYVNYTVKANETILSIAKKLRVNEYMILESNPKLSDYTSVKAGDQIKVPNYYAKFILLYVDQENFLPIGSHVFDDKGLYESYEYDKVQLNTKIDPEEFTKYFKGYKF